MAIFSISPSGNFRLSNSRACAAAPPLPGCLNRQQCKYAGQSVRAVPIRIITVGKKRSPGVQLLADEYISKLRHYCSVDDIQVKSNPKSARDVRTQVEDEDAAVMNLIRPDDWVVMLDERGLDIGSEQMAECLGDAGFTGASRLSFCIGGPYGHGQQIRKRANVSIRLSSMVLNHQIALLVLIEQLYSALQVLDYPQRTKLPSLVIFALRLSTQQGIMAVAVASSVLTSWAHLVNCFF